MIITFSDNDIADFKQLRPLYKASCCCWLSFYAEGAEKPWIGDAYAQSGFQSGLETVPLAVVIAGYCHFLGQFQARSSTCIDISKKVLYQKSFHFTCKLLIVNEI